MPKDGSAGYSLFTEDKQERVATVLKAAVAVTYAILKKYPRYAHPHAVYIDLTAGPGIVNGRPGSPLIAAREAANQRAPTELYLFEEDRKSAHRLSEALFALDLPPSVTWQVIRGDCRKTAADFADLLSMRLRGQPFGLIYADPNGIVPIEAIRAILDRPLFRQLDVLLHFDALMPRRINGTHARWKRQLSVRDLWKAVGKDLVYLTEPVHDGSKDWVFSLHTNYKRYPVPVKEGFVARESEQGRLYEAKACESRTRSDRAVERHRGARPVPGLLTVGGGADDGSR